jgi:hypothetical protein
MAVQRGNNAFGRIEQSPTIPGRIFLRMRDLFLHALFARLAFNDDDTVEFRTVYDPDTETIELDIPNKALPFLDQITGIQRGENFKTFINWLIGSDTITPTPVVFDQDPNFVSASALSVWAGATQANLEGNQIVLLLPASELSAVGYNTKTADDFVMGQLSLYLIWVYDSGGNNGFSIRTNTKIVDVATGNTVESIDTTNISTLNLLQGDIRETLLFTTSNYVEAGQVISLMLSRNYEGSADPATDLVGIVGLRISFDG